MLIERQRYIWIEKDSIVQGTIIEINSQLIGCCLVPNKEQYLAKGKGFWVGANDVKNEYLALLPNQDKPNEIT